MDPDAIKLDLMKAQNFLRSKMGEERHIWPPKVWVIPDGTVDLAADHEFCGSDPSFHPPFASTWPYDTMSYIAQWPDGHEARHVAMRTADDEWVEILNVD